MFVLDLVKKRDELENTLVSLSSNFQDLVEDREKISSILVEIEKCIDSIRNINSSLIEIYTATYISPTETILDLILYIEAVGEKISVLRSILDEIEKFEERFRKRPKVDKEIVFSSLLHYSSLRNRLEKKLEKVYKETKI